jgi:hypothetical protein
LSDDDRKLLNWPRVHRNAGFPINDTQQAENLQKQLGHKKRTSNDGRLHSFTNRRNTVRCNVEIQSRNVLAERTNCPLTAPTCVNVTGTDPENGFVAENRKNHLA